MIKLPLQITVSPEDTVAVSRIEQTARETIEHIATTPLEELIPEASEGGHSNAGVIGFALGFVIMMILDCALG